MDETTIISVLAGLFIGVVTGHVAYLRREHRKMSASLKAASDDVKYSIRMMELMNRLLLEQKAKRKANAKDEMIQQ